MKKASALLLAALVGLNINVAPAAEPAATPPPPVRLTANQALPTEVTQLYIIDNKVAVAPAQLVEVGTPTLVHYTGWLYDPKAPGGKGAPFDSSRTRVAPFSFMVGAGKVIKGWDQGVVGMRNGGVRTIIIPAALAYGERSTPKIPANSNLIFEVEVVNVIDRPTGTKAVSGGATNLPVLEPQISQPPKRLDAKAALPEKPTELTLIDQVVGSGKTAEAGVPVSVHYTGWLYDATKPSGKATKFDSSVDRGQPFGFPLGGRRVIKGWDQGVVGMKVGGKRTLIIPPDFGYGERGAGGVIPPNATLIFDVELLDVNPAAPAAK